MFLLIWEVLVGISMLNKFEPNFQIELESAGNISANVRTEFESIGINQTYHKIFLDIDSRIGILTPFDTFGKDVNTEVLLTEAIIVGDVPTTYYNFDNIDDMKETFEFVK